MATQQNVPDTARTYERAKPEKESGMGRLDNNAGTPTNRPDRSEDAIKNKQNADRQINADDEGLADDVDRSGQVVDHTMFDEEPTGWDQAPQAIKDPQQKRHPRTEGKGGTP